MVVVPTWAVTVLVSALVDLSVAVVWPFASVAAGVETLLAAPLTDNATVCPETRLKFGSRRVTVMVATVLPSAVTLLFGLTVTVESDSLTGPGTKVTVAFGVMVVAPTRAVTVLVSARAEESKAVVCPLPSVGAGLE